MQNQTEYEMIHEWQQYIKRLSDVMTNLTLNRRENHNDRSAAHKCRMIIACVSNRFEQDFARRSLYILWVYICARTHTYTHIHIYTHIYIYIYIYTYVYIYTHTYTRPAFRCDCVFRQKAILFHHAFYWPSSFNLVETKHKVGGRRQTRDASVIHITSNFLWTIDN